MSGMGVVGLGNPAPPRQDTPLHVLRQITTTTYEHPDHHVTADEAIATRIKRLREAKTPYVRDGMTLRFTDPHGVHTELTYLPPGGDPRG